MLLLWYFRGDDLGDHRLLGRPLHVFRRLKVHRVPRSSLFKGEREIYRERERLPCVSIRGGKNDRFSKTTRAFRESKETKRALLFTLDKCGSLSAPRTISAHALAYFKYDIPAILQYAAELAAADMCFFFLLVPSYPF